MNFKEVKQKINIDWFVIRSFSTEEEVKRNFAYYAKANHRYPKKYKQFCADPQNVKATLGWVPVAAVRGECTYDCSAKVEISWSETIHTADEVTTTTITDEYGYTSTTEDRTPIYKTVKGSRSGGIVEYSGHVDEEFDIPIGSAPYFSTDGYTKTDMLSDKEVNDDMKVFANPSFFDLKEIGAKTRQITRNKAENNSKESLRKMAKAYEAKAIETACCENIKFNEKSINEGINSLVFIPVWEITTNYDGQEYKSYLSNRLHGYELDDRVKNKKLERSESFDKVLAVTSIGFGCLVLLSFLVAFVWMSIESINNFMEPSQYAWDASSPGWKVVGISLLGGLLCFLPLVAVRFRSLTVKIFSALLVFAIAGASVAFWVDAYAGFFPF